MKVEKGGGKVRRSLTEVDSWTKISAWLVRLVCLMLFDYVRGGSTVLYVQHQLTPTHDAITVSKFMKHNMSSTLLIIC